MPSDTVMISILRDDEIYGPFDLDLIHAMLEEGRITPADLAKEEGGKWKPLEVFLREPAIHAAPRVPVTESRGAVREWQPYLNSPRPGHCNIAPYLAASFPSGHKSFKIRAEEFFGLFMLGLLLLLVPIIGWILGPIVMLGACAQLFDSRPDPRTFKEGWARMIGDIHRDGYRDGYMLFLGCTATLIAISSLGAFLLLDLDDSCVQGLWMIGVASLAGGGVWIYCYLVPKHLRK